MSKLNTSISASYLRPIVLLVLFLVYASTQNIDGLSNYQYENEEIKHILIPHDSFLLENINSRSGRSVITSGYNLPYGQMRIIGYKKRTIPIELQKALYAHGIVGRRR
ncbi:unnamed protein product [Adineta steineri]|uniref:Uncharacterized protein n=1 Tax=Adineta steineri TaxID=433720 RepID=A0A815GXD3_9BILA|nr:unnamed protein product [Adineta steineri]CAF1342914.1 unnamed protein product [Adineta steineri]CAF1346258.1 unnamed protein product [Adineta steineri]CAF1404585.1 unnamed protein product [Adineta steineri]CAF1408223.1 unnamed protein product [Adineta steineri]